MGREEPSQFSILLVALLIFLFVTQVVQARAIQRRRTCSSSCGDIKNISYPLRLESDPADCGHSDYQLSCQSNQTILELNSGKYYVKQILYEEHKFSVVDVNFVNGSCGLPYHSLGEYDVFTGYLKNDLYGLEHRARSGSFLNCSNNIIDDPAYREFPCLSGNHSHVYFFYQNSDSFSTILDIPESCYIISRVVLREASVKNPSYEVIQELLQSGFNLTWLDVSRDCQLRGGYCNSFSPENICNCEFYGLPISDLARAGLPISDLARAFLSVFTAIIGSFLLRMYVLLGAPILFFELYIRTGYFYDVLSSLSDNLSDYISSLYNSRHFIDLNSLYDFGHLIAVLFLDGNGYFFFDVIALFVIVRIFFLVVLIVVIIHKYIKTRKTVDKVEEFLHIQQALVPKRYSYIEIIAMTNHFRDKLGQGGFGSVYQGQLFDGRLIAVKVLLENSKFSGEEFINEVSTIGRIHHANVVRLLGFCSEGSKRALVYEYMPNGSLDRHIFLKKSTIGQAFSWEKLHEIALGTARGIEYLHNGCDVCILHFDIKPHNILLDRNFIPKVADFGLAKFYPKENDFVCVSVMRGTIGYIAPELISRNFGVVSSKSDVYSFGMLLLEMAGGRRNSFARATHSSKAYFPSWAYDQMIKGRDLELGNVNEIEGVIARKLCIVGLWCIQVKAIDRPSMTKVVEMLEGRIDDLQMPPKPFFAAAASSSSSFQKSSIREIQSDCSTESMEECSYSDAYDE